MEIGTHHFVSIGMAEIYYRSQGYEGNVLAAVKEKIAEGAIAIGSPTLTGNQRVRVNSEGRYVIEDGTP